jgi:hypothetical protein
LPGEHKNFFVCADILCPEGTVPIDVAAMSSSESAHPDPSVVPQQPIEAEKGSVAPVQPSESPALKKIPTEVKATLSKTDETLLRLSKYAENVIKTLSHWD